jgi:hypothetical protein
MSDFFTLFACVSVGFPYSFAPARMADSQFLVLEHKLPGRIGLSEDQIRDWRNAHLAKGTDWLRQGRWIKWTEDGVRRLEAFHAVELNPAPKPPEERWAEVTRCNFPNARIIEVKEVVDADTDWPVRLVRIKPEWRDLYKPRMRIKILTNGEPIATTRRPKGRYQF